jgi:predicted RecB family nuclease
MRAGAEIIYQATFVDGNWRGRADFLERVDRPTALGAWGYEPLDAKLARTEKPTYVVQLCFYADAIGRVQGVAPEQMHVLLGIGERRTLRHADFVAYYRRLRRGFETAIARPAASEPYPVEHCALCEFREVCDERWRAEDHLVLVASMRRDQVPRLRSAGLPTLAGLAGAAPDTDVERMAARTFETLRDQAGLQLSRRTTGRLEWHLLPAEPGCGFALLPRPSAGDVVFDIEGDPFWEPARGLHFLFGLLVPDGGQWAYRPSWAHTRGEERSSFEALVDFLHECLARHPDLHVYHYGAYETAAITQLMGVYATREDAVDALLRRKVFVDLHKIVRQGLRAGVPGYSLKEVEQLAGFQRSAGVRSGTLAVLEYEHWMESRDGARLEAIAAYNQEDCRATLALRDWLLGQRPEAVPWPDALAPSDLAENRLAADREREALRQALIEGTAAGSPRWLAGELLEYHRREARPAWWWFFERRDQMSPADLVDDTESIGKLEPTGEPPIFIRRSFVHRLRFPAQQHKLAPGDTPVDPVTKAAAGTIHAVDDEAGVLALRRGPGLQRVPLPKALIPSGPYDTREQRVALARLASSIMAGGAGYPALRDLLGRTRPRFAGSAHGGRVVDECPGRSAGPERCRFHGCGALQRPGPSATSVARRGRLG